MLLPYTLLTKIYLCRSKTYFLQRLTKENATYINFEIEITLNVCSAIRLKVLVACKGANPANIGSTLMDK